MKRLISLFVVLVLSLTMALPVGAYTFEKDYIQKSAGESVYDSSAVKWNGRTELKPNTYYYTTSNVVVKKNFTLPENSELEVRGLLMLNNNATLTVNGGLIIDYKGRVNAYRGTLNISDVGCVSCYGTMDIGGKGTVNADNELVIYDAGRLNVSGTLNISETGEVINGGNVQIHSTGKCNKDIITPLNITEELEETLATLGDDDKLQVDFYYYDTDVMENTRFDGMNYLDVTLLLQDNIYIPQRISNRYFSGTAGSYKELKQLLAEKTDLDLRYMQSEFGSSDAYSDFLSNDYFTNVRRNIRYENTKHGRIELNKYGVTRKYQKLLDTHVRLADLLNAALLEQLENELQLENVSARNVYANGYGVFTALLSKDQIYSLAKDSRFLFLSVTDKANFYNGKDKLYLLDHDFSGGYAPIDEYPKHYDMASVVLKKDICDIESLSSEVTRSITKYVTIPDDFPYTYYDTGVAGFKNVTDFSDIRISGLYRFHSFTDDLMKYNGNINLNKLYFEAEKSVSSYVYHIVDIDSVDDLKALVEDDEVVLILEVQFTLD